MMQKSYQMCTRCVMDTSAADIEFDERGVCNYCTEFLERSGSVLNKDPEQRKRELDALVGRIKAAGRGRRYDCVIGVSGGVDSSWVLVQAVKAGLRPLAVHMDNGWNSELAQNNIANLVGGLGVDLYTHVIDWDEYRKLMQAFFDADVIDVELLYDNAMFGVNYTQAARQGTRFILGGTNQATEGMRIPTNWNWFKFDKRNIRALGKRFAKIDIKTFPAIGTLDYMWYEFLRRIRWVSFLDYLEFNKADTLEALQRDYGYKPYPYKHYESIFTRFYQGYILPQKFGVDKRHLHLGTLVTSGQISREDAMAGLAGIPYASERALEEDKAYFLKKMGWSEAELVSYIERPERSHLEYPSERPFWLALAKLYSALPRLKGSA
jgi:N-acetyl sugar amidotransferase